ncbi:CBS domain containing protein [Methanonatronarchaeum thermophilum]|uniref:CBS domain containing protein n=1 Tax=Methanonatronarchaeum thermophilum TaxID=1927129 RepID=A0A1Y3GFT5_9EURY|nr:CBS domain-containing protein [Methanonatronarchaeum thermophilum]OUJ19163.1 CBS domain containing protein [Methanonatronarchaeum thermophilum]
MSGIKAGDIMIPCSRVVCIGPDDHLAKARLVMSRNNVGGLPVTVEGRIVGFITLRDITLCPAPPEFRVSEMMTRDVITKDVDTSVKELADIMVETGIQRIPIVSGGSLVGLVTQSSVIKAARDVL